MRGVLTRRQQALLAATSSLQLLARGQTPESIRLIDFRPPSRIDLLNRNASKVQFVQADISSETSTNEAFSKPWPKSVASLPLTVFHTAAVINPSDRAKSLLYRCTDVIPLERPTSSTLPKRLEPTSLSPRLLALSIVGL